MHGGKLSRIGWIFFIFMDSGIVFMDSGGGKTLIFLCYIDYCCLFFSYLLILLASVMCKVIKNYTHLIESLFSGLETYTC